MRVRILMLLAALGSASAIRAQAPQPEVAPNADGFEVKKLTLRPAAGPPQSLRYTLLPPARDRQTGNALTLYYRAFSPEWWGQINRDKDFYEKAEKWQTMPLKDLLASGEVNWLTHFHALKEVDRAARRNHCDWELHERLRTDGIGLLLPDLQSMRTFALLLSLRCRLEMAAGEFDKAIYTLQSGFALAKHTGEGPTLIHGLVGYAISAVMMGRLEELLQQPGAPNLYWALSALPPGVFDLKHALEGEEMMTSGYFPDLRELEKGPMTVERARTVVNDIIRKTAGFSDGPRNESASQFVAAGWIALAYSHSKERLVAAGRPREQVEAMPAAQVVLLDSITEFVRLRDDMTKGFLVPYIEGAPIIERASRAMKKSITENQHNQILRVYLMLLPALEKVHQATVRSDRRICFLRTQEAIRLHASANDGKPPAKLSDITAVPVPLDPATGKQFVYGLKGNTVELTAPHVPGFAKVPGNAWRYEITIGK